jgi:hypothetical protein
MLEELAMAMFWISRWAIHALDVIGMLAFGCFHLAEAGNRNLLSLVSTRFISFLCGITSPLGT